MHVIRHIEYPGSSRYIVPSTSSLAGDVTFKFGPDKSSPA